MPVRFLPRRNSCCFFIKDLKWAAIFIALFGLVEGIITVIIFIEACNTLYTANGHLGIPMLVWIGCTTTFGIFLIIGAICFFLQILFKRQYADNLFIWLLIIVPIFNIVYFILTVLRVNVDKVQCRPFGHDFELHQSSPGSAYLTFVSLSISGLSIYYAFIVNAYSRDLRNKRRSVNSQSSLDNSPDSLKKHLNSIWGMKSQNVFHIQEFALHNVSRDLSNTPHYNRKNIKKKSTKRKNKKHSISSTSNGSLRFQDNTSDSNDSMYEREKYYERNDYNKQDDHYKHGDHNIHDDHNKQEENNKRDGHN